MKTYGIDPPDGLFERVRYYGYGNVDYILVWTEPHSCTLTAFADSAVTAFDMGERRIDLELSREQMEQLRDQLDRALNAKEAS